MWTRGHTENDYPCLWFHAVVIAFAVLKDVIGSGGHNPVGVATITEASVMRIKRLPDRTRSLLPRDLLPLTVHPFMRDSIELHVNLRHYGNYQTWDTYWMNCDIASGILQHNRIEQLFEGVGREGLEAEDVEDANKSPRLRRIERIPRELRVDEAHRPTEEL